MKQIIFSFILVVLFVNVKAQISDADAKIKYQQIEDSYNSKKFTSAAEQALDLITKMNALTPKVGYIYLKSRYKAYAETGQADQQPIANYKNFKDIYDFCGELFKMINKSTYPADKYGELLAIQKYFKDKTDEYISQKDRTPQDAVDFLNECTKIYKGGLLKYAIDPGHSFMSDAKISFQLVDHFLKVTCVSDEMVGSTKRLEVRVDIYDLTESKIATPDRFGGIVVTPYYTKRFYNSLFDYNSKNKYRMKQKQAAEEMVKSLVDLIPSENTINGMEKMDSLKAKRDGHSDDQFHFLDYFFIPEDSYRIRMTEAMKFLVDAFPKKKDEPVNQLKSKF